MPARRIHDEGHRVVSAACLVEVAQFGVKLDPPQAAVRFFFVALARTFVEVRLLFVAHYHLVNSSQCPALCVFELVELADREAHVAGFPRFADEKRIGIFVEVT